MLSSVECAVLIFFIAQVKCFDATKNNIPTIFHTFTLGNNPYNFKAKYIYSHSLTWSQIVEEDSRKSYLSWIGKLESQNIILKDS